ncbi:MAG: copper resistance protein NlpE N-terminal domain-containing protein [Draconibacterium sp.]
MKLQFLATLVLMIAVMSCKTREKTTKTVGDGHNSQNSLDWAGTYRDTLPCADCEGILIEIILKTDLTYESASKYLGKDGDIFRSNGKFSWSKDGSTITLEGVDATKESNQFKVAENKLLKLDMEGKVITGNLADKYIIQKQQNVLTGRYWRLVELRGKKIEKAGNSPKEAFLFINTDGKSIYGNAGCNSVHGGIEIGEMNRIKFLKMASTMMACPDMEAEREFLQVLETADNYNLIGDTLVLNRARMAPLARFENVFLR